MTTFIQLCLLLTLSVVALAGPGTPNPQQPANYVVLLDLSDRLLQPEQARRDIALIQAVFGRFEEEVRRNLIINSRDQFRVAIAPQQGIAYRPDAYMEDLYLDMSVLGIGDKRKRLDAFKAALPGRLTRLYREATAGKTGSRQFAGCDLWQYFNEQLPTDLAADRRNVLVILTDGYFDFEQNRHAKRQGNRTTDSQMLERLRHDPQWRQTLSRPTEGLLPVGKPFPNLVVCVAEIRPKYDNLDEMDLLTALWTKWLTEMRITRSSCQRQGSLPKSLAMVQGFLRP
ncbi:hypothetical protein GCM10023187_34560 [Nibrella viscosa]|uniref:VWFA domain-containing protein n=1 Tax=Nibrella viscosa TaxID=1084524 RepID=A0ABP8KLL1_9BACT